MSARLARLILPVALTLALPATAQTAAPQAQVPQGQIAPAQSGAQPAELQQAITKSNAYVGLMNRTLRAGESWRRYQSWVKSPAGPTGRERIVYGLYGLYDVRSEIAKARAAM
ncbi:MAG: DUF3829 domain-containing protein, partial [Methylobacteriaceae bacterium]|nr:DUF3829 domain-containing protein [Methylobacteriaceae bacterium]